MNRKVLILNQDYRPLTICTVQKGFLLVFLKKAELISKDEDKVLRSISQTFPMPSVVRLNRFVRMNYKSVELTRQNIFKRDGFQCQYCGDDDDLTLDHVIPRANQGKSTWKNLVTACKKCNSEKGDTSIEEFPKPLKAVPFKPSYIMFLRDFSGHNCDDWKPYLQAG